MIQKRQGSWIWEENLIPFCELAAGLVGYDFDSSDIDALTYGLSTTDETQGIWFEYVLAGNQELFLRFTRESETSVITLETFCPEHLNQELSMLYQVCASYILSRGQHV